LSVSALTLKTVWRQVRQEFKRSSQPRKSLRIQPSPGKQHWHLFLGLTIMGN